VNRILIAVDGSAAAREAERVGLELAAEHGARVTFVHVVPRYEPGPIGIGVPALRERHVAEADRRPLRDAEENACLQDVPADTVLARGDAIAGIVSTADAIDADVIVVGSRGHGGLTSALLGSVSRGVMRRTRRPVVVVRGAGVAEPAAATR
jgi:nucleotide-binding universal stress UspA family protein